MGFQPLCCCTRCGRPGGCKNPVARQGFTCAQCSRNGCICQGNCDRIEAQMNARRFKIRN